MPTTPPPAGPRGRGLTAPIGEVVTEGRQPWTVRPPRVGQPFLVVSAGAVRVQAHDRAALDSHVQAWSRACALAPRVFDQPVPAFSRAVEQARTRLILEHARRSGRPPPPRAGR